MAAPKKLIVKNTRRYGVGVFATKEIKQGEIVHTLSGEKIDVREVVRRINSGAENSNDPLQVGRRTYIDLDKFSRSINHSCDPSCGLRKNTELFARRDIEVGEQISYDYSMTIAPTDWEMKCLCGSPKCRKKIGDVRSIPKRQREKYLSEGAVQRYMKGVLKELARGTYRIPKYEALALEQLGNKRYE